MNIVVSASGGRSSMLMAKKMKEEAKWREHNLIFVFANTGKEEEATLEFCNECDKRFGLGLVWVEAKVHPEMGIGTDYSLVSFETASRDGKPFEDMIRKYGIPNKMFPHCTRELKMRPINAYASSVFGVNNYVTAIGMRFDEIRRAKPRKEFIYPLVDEWITVTQVREFWNQQDFDLRLKDYEGNCDLCWKKSLRKKLTLLKERPQIADWWSRMEQLYSGMQLEHRQKINGPVNFNRGSVPVTKLVEQSTEPFTPVSDPLYRERQTPEMDDEQPCSCTYDERLLDGDDD